MKQAGEVMVKLDDAKSLCVSPGAQSAIDFPLSALLVSENPDLAWYGKELLTAAGCKVRTAGAEQAETDLYRNLFSQYDCVMIDAEQALVDLGRFTESCKSRHPHLPLIVMVPKDFHQLSRQIGGLRSSIDYSLSKPLAYADLLDCLKLVQRRFSKANIKEVSRTPVGRPKISNPSSRNPIRDLMALAFQLTPNELAMHFLMEGLTYRGRILARCFPFFVRKLYSVELQIIENALESSNVLAFIQEIQDIHTFNRLHLKLWRRLVGLRVSVSKLIKLASMAKKQESLMPVNPV